jgi:hypothetical protein
MAFKSKAVLPKKFDVKSLTDVVDVVAKQFSVDAKKELLQPTSTWNHSVCFEQKIITTRGKVTVTIFTKDDIYRFLDQGTKVRYATMTPDFSPKTRVRTLSASSGIGGLSYVSLLKPRRGIEAREFTSVVKENQERKLVPLFGNALKIGVIKSGHAI